MILIPTFNRPQNVRRFCEAYEKTNAILPVVFLLSADDPQAILTQNIAVLFNHRCDMYPAHAGGAGWVLQQFYIDEPNHNFYACLADDVVPETIEWDVTLLSACLEYGLAWADDGIQREKLCTHPFIKGEMVRQWGGLNPAGIQHIGLDDWWLKVSKGKQKYVPEVKLTHYHWSNGKTNKDKTYRRGR